MAANAFELARDEFRRALDDYGLAVASRPEGVVRAYERLEETWNHMRAAAPLESAEAGASQDMILVLALSHAAEARNEEEAKRLYEMMDSERRRHTDDADATNPGWIKVWLRRD